MLVSAEPNLHNALLGCYKIALHFGSAETQYPMHRIDQSRGGIDLLRSDEEVYLASKHILLTRKIGGDDNTVSTPLFTIYGLAVTVSSKEWCPLHISCALRAKLFSCRLWYSTRM